MLCTRLLLFTSHKYLINITEKIYGFSQHEVNKTHSFIIEKVYFLVWSWMFLNILRLSASNVLKTISNVIVSIGIVLGVHLLFSIRTNQPEA